MLDIEAIETLVHLGLTKCQSRVYIALCQVGAANAKIASKFADVPRQDFYRIVSTLQELGLVEQIISYPLTFKAIPIDKGTSLLLKQRKQETKNLEKRIKDILENFKIDNSWETPLENPMFVLVSGKNMVIKKLSKLIAKAESSIYVKTSWRRFSKVHYFIDLLMEACSRGVKIRFIVETPPKNTALEPILGLFNKNKNCEVRFIPYFPDTILTLFDRKEVLIISNPKAELTESKALWSNSQSLLASMHKFYEVKWIEARKEPRYLRTRMKRTT